MTKRIQDVSAAIKFIYSGNLNVVAETKGATFQGVSDVAEELGLISLLNSAALKVN